jgi:hypothetical protein
MADNLELNAGSGGSTLATDDIGGVHYQLCKLGFGALDSFTILTATAGLPVVAQTGATWAVTQSGTWNITNISGTVSLPTGASTAANQGTGNTALAAIQTAVEGTLTVGSHAVTNTVLSVVGGGTEAAAQRVTIANDSTGVLTVDGTVTANLSATDNAVLDAIAASVAGTLTVDLGANNDVTVTGTVDLGATDNAVLDAIAASVAGTLTVGSHAVTNAGTFVVQDNPQTSGGLSMHKTISAASTNATNVKASAGQLYSVQVFNTNAAARYLKLYNDSSAPTVGTDTPVKTLTIPGNTAGAGLVLNWDKGLAFASGIGFGLTTGAADNDTGAVAAAEIVVNLDYK